MYVCVCVCICIERNNKGLMEVLCVYICMYVSLIGDMHILHMYIMRVDRCCMYDNHVWSSHVSAWRVYGSMVCLYVVSISHHDQSTVSEEWLWELDAQFCLNDQRQTHGVMGGESHDIVTTRKVNLGDCSALCRDWHSDFLTPWCSFLDGVRSPWCLFTKSRSGRIGQC